MKKLLLIFIVLLLIPLAFAASPHLQTSDSTIGLVIEAPVVDYIELNEHAYLHTHVFNATTGLTVTNETTSCFVHLYNKTGEHILQENMGFDSNGLEFKLNIGGGNFSSVGIMTFIIVCNTSEVGGFVHNNIEITADGLNSEVTDSTAGLAIVIFILSIVSLLIALPFIKQFSKNKFIDLILKRGCWSIAIYLMMMNSAIVATIAKSANLNLTDEMFRYMWLWGTAGWIFLGFMFLKTIFDLIEIWKQEADNIRMGGDD